MNNLYQHRILGTLSTVTREGSGWLEFYDHGHNELRWLESSVFYSHNEPVDLAEHRQQARSQNILIPKELD